MQAVRGGHSAGINRSVVGCSGGSGACRRGTAIEQTGVMLSLAHAIRPDGSPSVLGVRFNLVRAGGGVSPHDIALVQAKQIGGASLPWLVFERRALPLRRWVGSPLGRARSVTQLVRNWGAYADDLHALTTSSVTRDLMLSRGCDVDTLLVQAPIRPRQTFCTIGNYRRQVVEAAMDAGDGPNGPGAAQRQADALEALQRRDRTGEPYMCLTSSERIGDPVGSLKIAHDVTTLDWEVEIAVVIGGIADQVPTESAANVIAGYCVANDLTVRSRVVRDDLPALGTDWIQSKGMPGTLPIGPWFVPAWYVSDVSALRLRLWLNDTLMQDDTAEDMVFGVERQISYLSRHTTLRPGDVICTGSPAGFGAHHGRFLRAGDLVTAHVSGLGEQHLRCVSDGSAMPGEGHQQLRTSASADRGIGTERVK